MLNVMVKPETIIFLGHQGENLARCAVFDLGVFRSVYGDGSAQLLVIRPGDEEPYPVALEVNGDEAKWNITNADTAIAGNYGKAEMRWYVDDTLAKSTIWKTTVQAALGEPRDTPPAPYENWMEEMLGVAADAELSEMEAKNAMQGALEAKNGAEEAQEAAELSRDESVKAKDEAGNYSSEAEIFAKAAGLHAEEASSSETAAAEYSESALAYAEAAKGFQRGAETARSQTNTYMKTAGEFATAADSSAKEANASAESAEKSAKEAEEAATRLDNIRVENETLYF